MTGGEGFIASWLVRHLVTKYPSYNVISFDKLDYCSSLNNSRMLESRPNFQFFHGDVTNDKDVLQCLRRHHIDTIFHLAAHTHVDLSFGNSYNFTRTNVLGTHILLESAIAVGTIKRFYHISTDEVSANRVNERRERLHLLTLLLQVYGEVERDAADLTEHSLPLPTNPYAASKAAAENYVTAYVKSFRLPAVIVRLNNVYGPHQVSIKSTERGGNNTDGTSTPRRSFPSSSVCSSVESHCGFTVTACTPGGTCTLETLQTPSTPSSTEARLDRSTTWTPGMK